MIIEAKWKPDQWYDGNILVPLPTGSFVTTFRETAQSCRLTLKQIREAFRHLETLGIASFSTIKAPGRAHEATLCRVLKYSQYQTLTADNDANVDTTGHTSGTRRAHVGHTKSPLNTENGSKSFEFIEPKRLGETPLKEEDLKTERIEDSRPPKDGAIAFLKAYPVKVAQEQAVRAYLSRIDTMADHLQLMDGLAKHMVSSLWQDANGNLMLDEIARFYRPDTFIFTGKYKDSPPPAGGFGSSSKRIVNL